MNNECYFEFFPFLYQPPLTKEKKKVSKMGQRWYVKLGFGFGERIWGGVKKGGC